MIKLRHYQVDGIEGLRNAFSEGFNSPLLVSPTGSGKTVMFSYMAKTAVERGLSVLILNHRIELLKQTSKALCSFDVPHGLVNAKFTANYDYPAQIASVQTLIRRLEKMNFIPDLIIIDEAHHANAGTWKKIIEFYPRAKRVGVTATPCRTDGAGLGDMFDTLVMGCTVKELIELGFLVQPKVFSIPNAVDMSSISHSMGDFKKDEIAELFDTKFITGDAVDHYTKICGGEPAVAFCINIAHAEHVAEQFKQAGYRAKCVHGKMDEHDRNETLEGLGNGTWQVITSCDLISEGTDIPAISCAIMLRPTESLGLYLQQAGRAFRPLEGKEFAYILDHVGNVRRHGLPHQDREWSLDTTKRKKKKNDDEETIKHSECPKCYCQHEKAPSCPDCGFVYPVQIREVEVVDGDLVEVKEEEIKKAKKIEQGRAETLEELQEIARQRGYKVGWAKHIWRSRQQKINK